MLHPTHEQVSGQGVEFVHACVIPADQSALFQPANRSLLCLARTHSFNVNGSEQRSKEIQVKVPCRYDCPVDVFTPSIKTDIPQSVWFYILVTHIVQEIAHLLVTQLADRCRLYGLLLRVRRASQVSQ